MPEIIIDADRDGDGEVAVVEIKPSTALLFKIAETIAAAEAARIKIGRHTKEPDKTRALYSPPLPDEQRNNS